MQNDEIFLIFLGKKLKNFLRKNAKIFLCNLHKTQNSARADRARAEAKSNPYRQYGKYDGGIIMGFFQNKF